MKKLINIIFLLWIALVASAQSFRVKPDTTHIRIGEPITLNITAEISATDSVQWINSPSDTLTGKLRIIEKSKIDTSFDQDDITIKRLSQQIIITAFDSGYYAVPPFKIYINKDSLLSEPFLIQVETVQVDTSKAIKDIAPPISVEFSFKEWLQTYWPYIAGGTALLALLAYLIYYFFIKKKPEDIKPKEIKEILPPHVIALKKLQEIEHQALWKEGKEKDYHAQISEVLREYIENRFNINALEQTTGEILRNLRYAHIHQKDLDNLYRILFLADLVKYAKEKPLPDENIQSLILAKEFIENTKPKEEMHETTDKKEEN